MTTPDKIANKNGVSAGAISNIINKWRQALSLSILDALRELALTLKIGITPAQCSLGFRVAMAMAKLGIKEDDLESFILNIYNRCIDLGVTPGSIASCMVDLMGFNAVPISKISEYVQQKTGEKRNWRKKLTS